MRYRAGGGEALSNVAQQLRLEGEFNAEIPETSSVVCLAFNLRQEYDVTVLFNLWGGNNECHSENSCTDR
ncbi:MAG: hypothetical protein ACR2NK_07590 [Mariniblastus sp.]